MRSAEIKNALLIVKLSSESKGSWKYSLKLYNSGKMRVDLLIIICGGNPSTQKGQKLNIMLCLHSSKVILFCSTKHTGKKGDLKTISLITYSRLN